MDCPTGWAAGSVESPICGPCVEGRFGEHNRTQCTRCPKGWATGIAKSSSCTLCAAGRSQGVHGGTSCLDCAPGYFSLADGSTSCEACPRGFHQPLRVQTSCLDAIRARHQISRVAVVWYSPTQMMSSSKNRRLRSFLQKTAVEDVPLEVDSPPNVRKVNVLIEEPAPAVDSGIGITVAPVYTELWWAQREDFTDRQLVGRITPSGWNYQTKLWTVHPRWRRGINNWWLSFQFLCIPKDSPFACVQHPT